MAERTTETTITFRRPFRLSCFDQMQPAGNYRLVIDEDKIPGLSCIAYQRTATMLQVPSVGELAVGEHDGVRKIIPIDSSELANALEADARVSLGLN